jgi:hypothetical protein
VKAIVAAILVFAHLWAHLAMAQLQPLPAGRIEGAIVRVDTNEPIAGAQVALTLTNVSSRPIPAIATVEDGKFVFKDLPAGAYRIRVTAPGFGNQQYGQGRLLFLAADQVFREATIRMTPTGTVSGRVFDEKGQPATGAPMHLLRAAYSPEGTNVVVAGKTTVDDRADYRLFAIPPGQYYLLAGTPLGPLPAGAQNASRYTRVYYPAEPDLDRARLVEVKPGKETLLDMQVRRATKSYSVRGRILDSTGLGLPRNLGVRLVYKSLGTLDQPGAFSSGPGYDPATQTFEIHNVPPGDYVVQAQLPRDRLEGAGPGAQATRPFAHARIQVTDADVEGIALNMNRGVNISGRLVVEGQPLSALTNLPQIALVLDSGDLALTEAAPQMLPATADGAFQVVGLRDTTYRVTLRGVPPAGLYLQSIRYNGEDILTTPLRFTSANTGGFEIVFRSGAAQIAGTVRNVASQLEAGIQVVLLPNDRARANDYRLAMTDQNAQFRMSGLTPGEYKLFSWEVFDEASVLNPDFLAKYEQQGLAVRVTESSQQSVEVKVIPR